MVQSRVQVCTVPVKIGLLASATISKLNTNWEKLAVSRIGEVKNFQPKLELWFPGDTNPDNEQMVEF